MRAVTIYGFKEDEHRCFGIGTLAPTPCINGIDVHVNEDDGELHANHARVIIATVLLSNDVTYLTDQLMSPCGDEEGYDDHELADDVQEGVSEHL
jgi:hypothetical protein